MKEEKILVSFSKELIPTPWFLSVGFITFYVILSDLSTECKIKLSENSVSNDVNSDEICFQRKTQMRL